MVAAVWRSVSTGGEAHAPTLPLVATRMTENAYASWQRGILTKLDSIGANLLAKAL